MRIKRIKAHIITGLLLLMLILPQLALANGPGIVPGSVSVTDITSTGAEIAWTTNSTSDSRVNYGPTTGLGQTRYNTAEVKNHNIILTGLTPNTTYYFDIWSNGERSPVNTSEYYSFKTLTVTEYSIILDHACGVCGDLVEVKVCGELIRVTATVAAAGTYHICWDSRAEANVVETFRATGAGSHTLAFFMPEAEQGIHYVYLTTAAYSDPATDTFDTFTVNPSVKIDPEEGPVDTEVTLNCYGFDATGDIRVSFLDTEETGKTNSVGSWEVDFTIPDTPAGGYTFDIEAKEGTVWVNWVSKYFEVIPEITVTPRLGTVGQTIEVEGTGFASEEEDIEVTFDGEPMKTNIPIVADENGSWEATFVIPPMQRGTYTIDASGESTRARDVDEINFILGAGLLLEPGSAYVGETITVYGGGFRPGETGIRVTFEGQSKATGITADSNGSWDASFVLPASTYGSNTVSASGDITKNAVEATLDTEARIEEFSPDEGAPGDSVTLTGSGFHGNQKLTVTLAGISAPGEDGQSLDVRTQTNGNINITFRVPKGSTEGTRTLVVRDEGGASDSVEFTVTEEILSTTPLPISPKGSTLRSGEVTFRWQGVTGDTGYTYKLEISKTADSGNIWSKSGIEGSSYRLMKTETVDEALEKGTYYWRIKIVDDYGNESPWSDYIEFRVSPIPPWVWVIVGIVVLTTLMVVAYRETKFKVTE